MSESDPLDRLVEQPEKKSPVSRLDDRVKDWLIESGEDLNQIVRVAMLRDQRPTTTRTVIQALGKEVDRKVLMALAWNGGTATYDDLLALQSVSKKRVRTRVKALEDAGLLERHRSKYVVVAFVDEATHIVTEDILATMWPSE